MGIINTVVFFMEQGEDKVNKTAIIVVLSVVAAGLGLPLLCFFVFHLFLAVTGNTTRQCLKKLEDTPDG